LGKRFRRRRELFRGCHPDETKRRKTLYSQGIASLGEKTRETPFWFGRFAEIIRDKAHRPAEPNVFARAFRAG
jgi:hypothetical protein